MIVRLLFVLVLSCCGWSTLAAQLPDESLLRTKAPSQFRVMFKTSKGDFTIEAYRSWSPLAVDRLYQLVISGYYSSNMIFRVERNYVLQFGITDQRALNFFWDKRRIQDEPVKQLHKKGIVAFARDVANSRAAQLFINMTDNLKLDTVVREGVKGYPPIGKVINGMDVLFRFNDRYQKQILPVQDSVYRYGNSYLNKHFPGLDIIYSATLLPASRKP